MLYPKGECVNSVIVLYGPLLTTHPGKLVHEHSRKPLFWCQVWIASIVPRDEALIHYQAVLVKDRLQCVNDSVLFSGGGATLLKGHTNLHFSSVLFHKLHHRPVTEVGFDQTHLTSELFTPAQDFPQSTIRVSILCGVDVPDKDVPIYLGQDHANRFILPSTGGVYSGDGVIPGHILGDRLGAVPAVTWKGHSG